MERHSQVLVIGLLTAITLAGCLGGGSTDTTGPSDAGNGDAADPGSTGGPVVVVTNATVDADVTMRNTSFLRSPTVSPGTVVRFKNDDGFPHTVTIRSQGIDQQVPAGGSVLLRFNEAGTYQVVCTIHSGMATTVTVRE